MHASNLNCQATSKRHSPAHQFLSLNIPFDSVYIPTVIKNSLYQTFLRIKGRINSYSTKTFYSFLLLKIYWYVLDLTKESISCSLTDYLIRNLLPITFRNNRSWVRMQYFLSILLEILIFLKPHFFITFFLIELNRSCLEINNRSSKRPQEILLTTAIDHPQDDLLIFKLNSIKNTTVLLWQQVIILPIFHLNVQNILLFLQTQQIRCPVYVQRASTMERK